jgi:hypothetical protein
VRVAPAHGIEKQASHRLNWARDSIGVLVEEEERLYVLQFFLSFYFGFLFFDFFAKTQKIKNRRGKSVMKGANETWSRAT